MELKFSDFSGRYTDSLINLNRLYDKYAKTKGLTAIGLSVIEIICLHQDGCTQKLISEELCYPKQSVNVIIRDLIEKGYVVLKAIPEDRRSKNVCLTDAGIEYAKEVVLPFWAAEAEAEKMFSDEDNFKFYDILEVHIKALEDIIDKSYSS